YAAKFRAYYQYRDSGQSERDYDGFPTLLCITEDPAAEHRIAEEAYRVCAMRNCDPLAVLITSTDRISTSEEGILGQIWRSPVPADWFETRDREYWLSGAVPRGTTGDASSVASALTVRRSKRRANR